MSPLRRSCLKLKNGNMKVIVGEIEAIVPENDFWETFARGWEPDTERIYRTHVMPGATVLDVGAWIGPTLLFALACGANRVIALEPNPQSHAAILRILALNPRLAESVTLLNRAAGPENGLMVMGLPAGENDTSTWGIGGEGPGIPTTTISRLYRVFELERVELIKIDIEGAEALLAEDFRWLSQQPGQVIHLSLHVPLFPESTDIFEFADAFRGYHIQDDRGHPLSQDEFTQRLSSSSENPEWGTRHGNFFEVLLQAKC